MCKHKLRSVGNIFLFHSQAFQRQVQEFLTQLELINKQYRRLARENRTDSSCHLKEMVHDGNKRWDNLQRRVASILRRLRVCYMLDVGFDNMELSSVLVTNRIYIYIITRSTSSARGRSLRRHETASWCG